MGYKKRVTPDELQQRLGVSWPPAHRFVVRYGFGRAMVDDTEGRDHEAGRWTVSEETAAAVVAAFREERDQAFWKSRRPNRPERL